METPQDIIERLYTEILGRSADPSGMLTYSNLIEHKDFAQGCAEIVRSLLASPEYFLRIARDPRLQLDALGARGDLRVGEQAVKHVISLGTHCLTSALLKKYRLKTYSLPFDWLFSSPEAVIHCLQDDFEKFLERRFYKSITARRRSKEAGADHLYYKEHFGVIDMFAHRDPADLDVDYAYTARTVTRFRTLLRSDDAKLFVMISRPEYAADARFGALSSLLSGLTRNSALICIQLRGPSFTPGCHSMQLIQRSGNHFLYQFIPSSKEFGLNFDEALDDLAIVRVIKQFSIDLQPIS